MSYMRQSIKKTGIDKHIQYETKLVSLNWNSQDALWELNLKVGKGEEKKVVRASWVVLGTGYYDYEKALPTTIPGLDNFKGKVSRQSLSLSALLNQVMFPRLFIHNSGLRT